MPAGTERNDASVPAGNHVRTTVLPNGLHVITERLPWVRSVALGLCFKLGGRDDPAGRAGMAHFIEHMVFKGTKDRDARSISVASEDHGAELNAFTDKELTCYYGRFPGDQQVPVTELLAEIVAGPAFDPGEMAKEKDVISEEIRSTTEDPDSEAANLMVKAAFGDHPMGIPIAGTHESVAAMEPGPLREAFLSRYHSGTSVAVAVGDVRHEELVEALSRRLAGWRDADGPARQPAAVAPPAIHVETRSDLSQVYICLARPAFAYPDPRRYALSVMNSIVGGGLSSRLFQRLREDEGLVYSVSSFAELYEDTGLLGIYFVTDRRKLERCLDVMREEIALLRKDRLHEDEFERARNMTKSAVLLGLESPTSRMLRMAKTHHLLGRLVTVDETLDAYNRLELDDANQMLDLVFGAGEFHVGAVGPISTDELRRLVAG